MFVSGTLSSFSVCSPANSPQVSNMVRVPFEVTKQRCQANRHVKPSEVIRQTLQSEVSGQAALLEDTGVCTIAVNIMLWGG